MIHYLSQMNRETTLPGQRLSSTLHSTGRAGELFG